MKNCTPVVLALLLSACDAPPADPRAAAYDRVCAGCHDEGVEGAPAKATLAQMDPRAIETSLVRGRMMAFGTLLSASERREVAEYITGRSGGASEVSPDQWLCEEVAPPANFGTGPRWNGWGVDRANRRFQPGEMAALDPERLRDLEVAWVFGYPDVVFAWSQPVVAGGVVFAGSYDGRFYALDQQRGCTRWWFQAEAGVRTAAIVVPGDSGSLGGPVVLFGDQGGTVYALDATDGGEIWRTEVEEHPLAVITAAPSLVGDRLFVPVSSLEERIAVSPEYPCCTFRGSVVALDVATGRLVWKRPMIDDEPQPRRVGWRHRRWGPSGAAVWVTPTVDEALSRVYVATGDNYTDPATARSDAVVALDMDSGEILWTRQMIEGDAWNTACSVSEHHSCPDEEGPDFDFGAAPVLANRPGGGRILVAPQKSGTVYGLDPDAEGALLWETALGSGGNDGALMWGAAVDDERVYVALSVTNTEPAASGGGVYALSLSTGDVVWHAPGPDANCVGEPGCNAAQSAALTLVPGAVFSGTRDGRLIAYDPASGERIWSFDTRQDLSTVNSVDAIGGSINAAGPTVVDGMLFVNSGYGAGGLPGNRLIALRQSSMPGDR